MTAPFREMEPSAIAWRIVRETSLFRGWLASQQERFEEVLPLAGRRSRMMAAMRYAAEPPGLAAAPAHRWKRASFASAPRLPSVAFICHALLDRERRIAARLNGTGRDAPADPSAIPDMRRLIRHTRRQLDRLEKRLAAGGGGAEERELFARSLKLHRQKLGGFSRRIGRPGRRPMSRTAEAAAVFPPVAARPAGLPRLRQWAVRARKWLAQPLIDVRLQ